jgi:hypothetical protein
LSVVFFFVRAFFIQSVNGYAPSAVWSTD